VSPETLERFTEAFRGSGFDPIAFAPCYGLAESTLGVSFCMTEIPAPVLTFEAAGFTCGQARPIEPNDEGTTLVGCGPALDGVEIAIVDPETRLARSEREIGEIWVRSPSIAAGYWNKPELSEQTFGASLASSPPSDTNRYLRTGDLGFLCDGNLFVTGRIKDLIILGGVNFYPEDVETTVTLCHPELHGAVAAFSVDHGNEERLVVVCEVNARRSSADDEIVKAVRKAVADRLELSVQDVLLVRAGALPRTSSGKLQRGACRKQYVEKQL
jgi:acyl-CoA synthetase (AMP-forming)/AMP-acid ligase II